MGPPPTPISASLWGSGPLHPSQAAAPTPPPTPPHQQAVAFPPPITMAQPLHVSMAPPPAPAPAPAPAPVPAPIRFGNDFVSMLVIILLTALTVYCITLSGRIVHLERQLTALLAPAHK